MEDFDGDCIYRSVADGFRFDRRMLFFDVFEELGGFVFIESGRYEEYVFRFRIFLLLELIHVATRYNSVFHEIMNCGRGG